MLPSANDNSSENTLWLRRFRRARGGWRGSYRLMFQKRLLADACANGPTPRTQASKQARSEEDVEEDDDA